MQIYSIGSLTQSLPKTDRAVALGVFDGVHIGHLAVIAQTKDTGGLTSSILTFNQDAKEKPKDTLPLFSKNDKQNLFAKTGVDEILDFDFECIRALSPEEFVKNPTGIDESKFTPEPPKLELTVMLSRSL